MMKRVLRWGLTPTSLLVLAITGCGGSNSPEEGRGASEMAGERPSAPAADDATPTRTVVLHVAGMMKSKSGAT